MNKSVKKNFHNFLYFLWSVFLKGFLTILPITLTIALLNVSFKILKGWLHPIYELEPSSLKAIPFSEFLLTFFFIVFIGIILNVFVLESLWVASENLIGRIPLIRPIYAGIKQLVHAFSPDDKNSFKHVVLIEFPRKGVYSIGFMTNEVHSALSPNNQKDYYNVFLPTTPNPTAGFFLIVHKNEIQITSLSRQEAMALIMSGGIITPERFVEK